MRKLTNKPMKIQAKTKLQTIAMLLCFSLLPGLRATTLARLSLDQLAAAADGVARVRCAAAESRWENGAIWTVTTFDVIETLKGSLPGQVVVHLPGGRVGHLTAAVDGAPKFRPGEQAVVFLERAGTGGYSVAGWVEGTFRIVQDPISRREIVTQDSSGFAVFDQATRTFRAEGIRKMPMEQFRARVGAAIARGREKSR
ncbi:MAG: hypothetical protein LAO19_22170 [Acidobacteriia bacterium]|nr:hypothetical protein [Terriglobia bacterium]